MKESDIPPVLSSSLLCEQFGRLRCDQLLLSNGRQFDYYVYDTYPHAVIVLAQTTDARFVINKEYRHPTKQILLSCPGGMVDEGESEEEAARRELLEETGYSADCWNRLGKAFPMAGIFSQEISFFYAQGATFRQDPTREENEIIQTQLLSLSELYRALASYPAIDGQLCSALFYYQRYRSGL